MSREEGSRWFARQCKEKVFIVGLHVCSVRVDRPIHEAES